MGRKAALALMLMACLFVFGGCGGQEIESCLFVLAMAVDPAPDGNLTVTIKALSGTQETPGGAQRGNDAGSGISVCAQRRSGCAAPCVFAARGASCIAGGAVRRFAPGGRSSGTVSAVGSGCRAACTGCGLHAGCGVSGAGAALSAEGTDPV